MSSLAVMALAAAAAGPVAPVTARLEGLALVPFEGRAAIRITHLGRPGPVTVTRAGNVARITLARTDLGWRFGAGRRFEWSPAATPVASFARASRSLERLTVEAGRGEASVVLDLPPEISLELRRERQAILVVLREAGHETPLIAQAPPAPLATAPPPLLPPILSPPVLREEPQTAPPAASERVADIPSGLVAPEPAAVAALEPPPVPALQPSADPMPEPEPPVAIEPVHPAAEAAAPAVASVPPAAPPEASTAELYRQLFPAGDASAASVPTEKDDTATLYAMLFPAASTAAASEVDEAIAAPASSEAPEGFRAGPFRLSPFFTLSYIDADASLLSVPGTVNDAYLQFEPGVTARAPVGMGSFQAEYAPAFRAGGSFSATQDASHVLQGTLDLPIGADSRLTLNDRFVLSTLDTREVDPGGEYFYDLAPFAHNLFSANARVGVGPRFYVELGGAVTRTQFDRPGGFFDYDSRLLSAGLGYELTPNLRATVSYVYDAVPEPEERPEAEGSAHSALLTLQGDLLPLLTGRLALGYRDQESPNAAAAGQSFQGFTMSGALTREFGRQSSLSIQLNRSTPVSAFEANGFYVNTLVSASVAAPLPGELILDAGLGYSWNDYQVRALEIGVPREDRIFSFYAGVQRHFGRRWWGSAYYRRERRHSNLDAFDITSDGLLAQVSWGLFGPRR